MTVSMAISYRMLPLLLGVLWGPLLQAAPTPRLSPVVFVPGHGGNQLDMRLNIERPLLDHCAKKTNGWVRSWLNVWQLLPGNIDCWVGYHQQTFNHETGRYSNMPGVEIRVPGWGDTHTTEYVDPSLTAYLLGNIGSYAAPLIKEMRKWGYKSGHNLRGAPYDFRYDPRFMPKFHDKLKALVEETFHDNDDTKVTLMAHSYGGVLAHSFLLRQTQAWKDQFVQSLVTMNTPWKGTVVMANTVISGYAWGHDSINPKSFRKAQRTTGSGSYLLPSPTEWAADEVIVRTAHKNYTSRMYRELGEDMDFPELGDMWDAVSDISGHNQHPGVDVFCLFGSGKPTPEVLVYDEDMFPDKQPHWVTGPGDGTINLRSSSACRHWQETADNIVYPREFFNTTHNGILRSKLVQKFLREMLSENVDW